MPTKVLLIKEPFRCVLGVVVVLATRKHNTRWTGPLTACVM